MKNIWLPKPVGEGCLLVLFSVLLYRRAYLELDKQIVLFLKDTW